MKKSESIEKKQLGELKEVNVLLIINTIATLITGLASIILTILYASK